MKKRLAWFGILAALVIAAGALYSAETRTDNNVRLSGSGTIAGGNYNNIEIFGSGTIDKSTTANTLRVDGSAEVMGDLRANLIRSMGTLRVHGSLTADNIESSGSLISTGPVDVKMLSASGNVDIDHLTGGDYSGNGSLKVARDVSLKSFKQTGSFQVFGNINAPQILVKLEGNSSVRNITSESLNVSRGLGAWVSMSRLTANDITADEIYLENTNARLVKGSVVKIGPGCNIDRVEYAQTISVSRDSKVGQQLKKR